MTDNERSYRNKRYEKYRLMYAAIMSCYPFTIEDLEGEIWKDIEFGNGRYKISSYGRIKSFFNGITKILKPALEKCGYFYIQLNYNGKHRDLKIHRLVAEAFIPNPENKKTVNHIDGNKMNNFVNNLEWATYKENNLHALETGLLKSGGESSMAKLTDEEAVWCRSVYIPRDKAFGIKPLAKKLGVSEDIIFNIVHGERYKNAEKNISTKLKLSTCPISE